MRPSIVFIRHGESSANEQNLIGGHTDAGLTALGRQQAREAGRRIRAGGLAFDRVHTSTLRRAWETAALALDEADQSHTPTVRTAALAERDFGVFTGKNKHLIRKSYGYDTYEACMNSPRMHLPQAESFQDMYQRVADYYHRVLVPGAERGERLLVVAHKYIIELFALVVAGVPADGYFDVRLPNSKPLNEEELGAYAQASSRLHKETADRVVFHTTEGVALAAGTGILARLLLQQPLEHIPFVLLSILLLGLISFFVMLGINSNHVLGRLSLRESYYRPWALRIAASIALFLLFRHSPWSYLFLLGLMPPALSSPALAVLWGGEQYTAVRSTIVLSLICAGITAALVALAGQGNLSGVALFLTVFVLAFVLPTAAAQGWRLARPIAAGSFALHWRWLGTVGLYGMAAVTMYRFTPDSLPALIGGDGGAAFLWQGAGVTGALLGLRGLGLLAARSAPAAQAVDIYISHATPAVFLWMVFVSAQPATLPLGFWGALLFFLGFWMDERYFVWKEKRTGDLFQAEDATGPQTVVSSGKPSKLHWQGR